MGKHRKASRSNRTAPETRRASSKSMSRRCDRRLHFCLTLLLSLSLSLSYYPSLSLSLSLSRSLFLSLSLSHTHTNTYTHTHKDKVSHGSQAFIPHTCSIDHTSKIACPCLSVSLLSHLPLISPVCLSLVFLVLALFRPDPFLLSFILLSLHMIVTLFLASELPH